MKKMIGLLLIICFVGCGEKGPQGLPVQAYWGDGPQVKAEGNKKDGKKDGKWVEYYRDGQIKYERNYKDGEKDGKWVEYH